MNKTVFVIGIIFLFIGACVGSSMGNLVKDNPADCSPLKSVYSSEEKFSHNTTWYEFILGGNNGTGFYAFYPNGTYRFREWEGDDFFSGGTWTNDGRYLCCMYENGTLYDIDPDTFDACAIGDGGVSLNGLTYNPLIEKLYGASSSDLYKIDLTTGEQTHVGAFGTGTTMIAIAFDGEGSLYGWDARFSGESYLYKINIFTGVATIVGGMGINLCFAQDGCFEYGTDTLYLVAYSAAGFLLECDEDTGDCIWLGSIQGEATAHAISYELEPPVSTHSLDPPEPDGENGWYVSNVNVTLTATDDMSGVREIRYTINGGAEQVIHGDNGSFMISEDEDIILVNYWAIDNSGNVEYPENFFIIDMDQTGPTVELVYEIIGGNPWQGWEYLITVTATDAISGMERVEIYIDDELVEILYGPGPYEWSFTGKLTRTIKAVGFDIAGNSGYAEIVCRNRNIVIKQSIYTLFSRLLERFPLLQKLPLYKIGL